MPWRERLHGLSRDGIEPGIGSQTRRQHSQCHLRRRFRHFQDQVDPDNDPRQSKCQAHDRQPRRSSGSSLKWRIVAPIPKATVAILWVASATAKGRPRKISTGNWMSPASPGKCREQVGHQWHQKQQGLFQPVHRFTPVAGIPGIYSAVMVEHNSCLETGILAR